MTPIPVLDNFSSYLKHPLKTEITIQTFQEVLSTKNKTLNSGYNAPRKQKLRWCNQMQISKMRWRAATNVRVKVAFSEIKNKTGLDVIEARA